MLQALQLIATFAAALFAGAALYINVAEHPSRMTLETRSAASQWAPSYKRATLMQAPLAVVSLVSGTAVWLLGADLGWFVAALLIGAVVPFTFLVIMPVNRLLLDVRRDLASPETRTLLEMEQTPCSTNSAEHRGIGPLFVAATRMKSVPNLSRLLWALALTLSSGACLALGRVVSYEELPFSSVTSLETCGQWRIDGQSGEFRVLQAYLYGGMMLFVDMVRPNEHGTWLEVKKGFTFSELNNDHLELELSDIRCSPKGANRIVITGRAKPFEMSRYAFTIEIDGETGAYQMKTR